MGLFRPHVSRNPLAPRQNDADNRPNAGWIDRARCMMHIIVYHCESRDLFSIMATAGLAFFIRREATTSVANSRQLF